MSAAAALRLGAHYLRHRFKAVHPFEVQAVLLNACNLRCSYCKCPEIKTALMTTEQWTSTVTQLGRLGTWRIKYQGGEPTLRHDFQEICRSSRQAGILTAVVTNGTMIAQNPGLLDDLDEVVVSVDAMTPERHDRYRGSGSHAAALRAISLARERHLRTCVNMVVHRDTLSEVEDVLRHCEAIGAGFHAQPVMFGSLYQDDAGRFLALSAETERDLNKQLAAWQRAGRGVLFSSTAYEASADWPHADHVPRRGRGQSDCMAGKYYVNIEANGDVHPCGLHQATFTAKNLVRDGLEAALAHAQIHDCSSCCLAYLNERKAVFALRPSALLHVMRTQ